MTHKTTKKAKNIRVKLVTLFNSSALQMLLWFFSGLVLFVSIYHAYFANKIVPGVYVAGVNVGKMSYDQAIDALQQAEENEYTTVSLAYKDRAFEIPASTINLHYNWDASVKRAYEVGRTGNIYIDTKDKIAGLIKPLNIQAFYSFDEETLSSILSKISGELNQEPSNASFVLNENGLEITPSKDGLLVEVSDLYNKVVYSFSAMDFKIQQIGVDQAKADIAESDLEKMRESVEALVLEPFTITYEDKKWTIDSKEMLNFILIRRESGILTLTLDNDRFEAYLDILAQEINQLPRGRVTKTEGDRVLAFELTQEGKELDVKQFTNDFKQALFDGKKTVQATINVVSGPSDPTKYGILSLLGEGHSKFTGSAAARVKNLTLAAERTNGVLVPPGGVYSFNNSVGEISGTNGYDSAYIISNGRTILGEGGGVCQTSTTLYRAVLNSGLPIVTRYPHAYRVYYYEIDAPVGFDASIYQPSLDFQFKNDTPNFILVQSTWNTSTQELEFKIYGTPDGREVEISEPVVTNVKAPPAPLYQDDPSLPKGVTKQIDFSAWGATVEYTRTVKRSGEVINQEVYKSTYQPWRAIYLVGTKT